MILTLLFVGFEVTLADVLTIADAEHHDDIICLFLRERIARNVPPVEVALRLVAQQAGVNLVLANDGDLR